MSFLRGLILGLKEIWANKFRSILTMIGVILGVAALVAMIGIIDGYFDSSEQWIVETGGIEKIAIVDDDPPEHQQAVAGRSPGRTMKDAEAILKSCPLAAYVSPEVSVRSSKLQYRDKVYRVRVQGVKQDVLPINNYELQEGRMVADLDIERYAQVIVVGTEVMRELGIPQHQVVGSTIRFRGVPFRVVGLLKHYEKMWGERNHLNWKNRIAFIPISTMQKKFADTQKLTWLNVEVKDVDLLNSLVEQLQNTLLQTHRGIEDFRVETKQEMVQRFAESRRTVTYAMSGVAAISLLIGGIGITNVMLASISQRIREIGIRKAVGARPWDIFLQFVAESTALSIVGGVLGMAASAALIKVLKFAFVKVNLVPQLSATAMLIGFSFSVGMGIIAGIYPAVRASRLDPIDALRYE